jgi:hypothetical protein
MSIRISIITISIEDIICDTQHKATLQSLHNNHQHSRLDFVTIGVMRLSIMKVSMKGLDCDNQQILYPAKLVLLILTLSITPYAILFRISNFFYAKRCCTECRYVECRSAECRYTECHFAVRH